MITRSLCAAVAVTVMAGSAASAADLGARPYTKAPALARVYDWSGFYLGANVGYGWGRSDTNTVLDQTSNWAAEAVPFQNTLIALSNQRISPKGVVGGLQAGYNWQAGAWVFGLEADINGSDINGRTSVTGPNAPVVSRAFNESIRNDWFATVRPRVGYAIDNTLLYVTGGLAVGNVKGSWDLTSSNTYNKTGAANTVNAGWTVGAGVEHGFAPRWTVKAEYLYTDLGSVSYISNYVPGSSFAPPGANYRELISQNLTFHTVRIGLNYKFGPLGR
jgi:outer membrane immunogenic protein